MVVQISNLLIGWVWSRILEKKLHWLKAGRFTGILRTSFVAFMCLITAIIQIWYEQGVIVDWNNLGNIFQYFSTIFLASQVVYELRGSKIKWDENFIEIVDGKPTDIE